MDKIKYFFTLVFVASVFLLLFAVFPSDVVFADGQKGFFAVEPTKKTDGIGSVIKPWDVTVALKYQDKEFAYRLSDNIADFTPEQIESRLIFRSPTVKGEWVADMAEKGIETEQSICFVLPCFKDFIEKVCSSLYCEPIDATVTFKPDAKEKFIYTKDKEGRQVNDKQLYEAVLKGLKKGETHLVNDLPVEKISPGLPLSAALNATKKRGEFTTDCSNSTKGRKNNIALALSFFNGKIIKHGERVSFNETVGARTKERGFDVAKVLLKGKYVDGVGGGVCQASTTLYNALLLSGVTVKGVCQHSLQSSYVLPSFDAMVSDAGADLVFLNDTGSDIYIAAKMTNGVARVEIYGLNKEYEIVRRSEIVGTIPYETKKVVDDGSYSHLVTFTDQTVTVSEGKDGIKSQGWLDYYKDGKKVNSRLIRVNTYGPTDRLLVTGSKERE